MAKEQAFAAWTRTAGNRLLQTGQKENPRQLGASMDSFDAEGKQLARSSPFRLVRRFCWHRVLVLSRVRVFLLLRGCTCVSLSRVSITSKGHARAFLVSKGRVFVSVINVGHVRVSIIKVMFVSPSIQSCSCLHH